MEIRFETIFNVTLSKLNPESDCVVKNKKNPELDTHIK